MKTDLLHGVLKSVDYKRYMIAGFILAVAVSAVLLGCEPKMPGLTTDAKPVSQDVFVLQAEKAKMDLSSRLADWETEGKKLEIESNALAATIDATDEGFAKKFEQRQAIVDAIGGVVLSAATGGTVTIGSVAATFIPLVIGLMGAGAYADKKRTDAVLAEKKAEKKIV